jgi:hypothetical protein
MTSMLTGTGRNFIGFVRNQFSLGFYHSNVTAPAKYLLTQFEKYWDEWEEVSDNFVKLTSRFSPQIIKRWEDMDTKPFIGRDGKPLSLFQVDSARGE